MKKDKILGVLLIIIALTIPLYSSISSKRKNNISNEEITDYLNKTSISMTEDIAITPKESKEYDYIAILEIPKINLQKGLVAIDSKYNDISYNVSILKTSEMPDIHNSNLILAAHNGNSEVSFFKDLEQLSNDDQIFIYYQGNKYIYNIANYYIVEKNGKVNIIRDKTKNAITLITCKNNSDNEQIIYIGYLIDKEIY